jgi:EmrB/QacA subfamily drug resistance transporter
MTRAQRWTLAAAILASGIVFLDSTVVNLALKRIGEELPAGLFGVLEGQAYVVSGYLAVLAALLIVSGSLADVYGRRKIFGIGLVLFGITSVLSGIAPTLEFLVVARVLQGAAGALLVPGSLAIITATFEGQARARAFGLWAASTSALTLFGPVLGGLIVDNLTWRLAFLINVPLVILALYATRTYMAESRDETADRHFDWLGSIVGALAVGGLAFGAIRGEQKQWSDPLAFAALGIGAICLVAFPILMATRPHPLVPLSLFRIREFAVINLATFLIYGALYVGFGYTALLYQGVLGYTALGAAIVGLPAGILLTVLSARVGVLAGRFGARMFLVTGALLMAAGQLWYSRIPVTSEPWVADFAVPSTLIPPIDVLIDVMPAVLLGGVGIALIVAPLTNTLMGSIPSRNSALGSAINNALSRVGQPLLGAVIFIAITASFYSGLAAQVPGLDPSDPELRAAVVPMNPPKPGTPPEVAAAAQAASIDAFHLAALVSAGLLFGGAIVCGVGLRTTARSGSGAREESRSAEAPEPIAGTG